ncbi:hypothetical protein [Geodermatophilus ruber]|uniref:hypothetical protein n=1 Tax=Geodermatophilus ruber TaxID=504800 RepID=UPI0015A69132|nr:hypothetical protein [Geodermatophilus ruber]
MADPTFTRSGAAARKPATSAPRAARRPRTATTKPAPAAVQPAGTSPAPVDDEVAVRLAIALAELPAEAADAVTGYRNRSFSDEQWVLVADLVRLGMAVGWPAGVRRGGGNIGWALGLHARVHLLLGTNRTVAGWYGPDAVATTLAGGHVGRGPDAFTLPPQFASAWNARLRTIGRVLVPSTPPPARKFTAGEPAAPLTAAELEEVLDFCAGHRSPRFGGRVGERLARMVWLICGTGARNEDLVTVVDGKPVHVTGEAVTRTPAAAVFTTAGPSPRRIPVLAACEAAVLDAAAAAGERPLLERLPRSTRITDRAIDSSGWAAEQRFTLNALRLRHTWLAAVLAGGVPYPALLRAAGIGGERILASLTARLPALDDAAYEAALRCGTGPLPTAGQLLLPGLTHPAPRPPLREQP